MRVLDQLGEAQESLVSFSAFFIAKKAIYRLISNLKLCPAIVPMQRVSGATVYVNAMLKKLPLRSTEVTFLNSCKLCGTYVWYKRNTFLREFVRSEYMSKIRYTNSLHSRK